MMRMWKVLGIGLAVMTAFMFLLSCSSETPPPQADETGDVEKAVLGYLSEVKQIDTSRMEAELSDLVVEGDNATCTASFSLKDDPAFPGMAFRYSLERREGTWTVVSSSAGAEGSPHGAPGGEPPAHGMMQTHEPVEDLPEGHPPIGTPDSEDEESPKADSP